MNPIHLSNLMRTTTVLFFCLVALALTSCLSNDELREKTENQNDAFFSLQERRDIRQDARDERYDARYDRIMH